VPMRPATFDRLRDIVYEASGISLSPSKRALLTARTGKRMRALGLTDADDYLKHLEGDGSGQELMWFLDAVSTNVTGFFREPSHFQVVRTAVKDWLDEGHLRLRMWSTACSSGEEPFSLAMTVLEAAEAREVDVRILATDISTGALETARNGVYSEERVQAIPPALRQRYVAKDATGERLSWLVAEEIRRMVVLRRLNLAEPPYPIAGPLDVVFCRNVMIYFDKPVREALLAEIHRVLRPGGLLFVGHAESLSARSGLFTMLRPSVFRRD
jgi:chemotaxis protein methyltransferase CheR